jgi:hypothetical protein
MTEDCVMELTGKHLAYRIALRGGWIWLSAQLMDKGDQPEPLVNVGDGEAGWRTISKLIEGLERSGCRSLQRPIEIGEGGPNAWVIG